jgi:ankyrin repeat protein
MRDPNLLEELARAAGAYTKERLPTIEQLQRDSITTSPDNQIEARQSLIVQRTNSVYYRDPTKQKRNLIRSKKEKAALLNTDNWTYTTAERYAVLDAHIRKGGSPGLAQAILSFDLNDPLDVNVAYVADNNGDAICTGKSNGWLELAAKRNERNDVAYIRLLTKFGASQASRDNALAIALEQGALETAQELFHNDANPNAIGIPDHFLSAIRDQNQRLYTMFLAARTPLNTFYINQALLQTVGRDTDLVALLIAHGADGMSNDGEALCASIDIHAMQDTAMILINSENDFLSAVLDKATNKACAIADEKTKLGFLKLLFSAGANANTPRIHDELLAAVKNEQFSLVQLLIDCETSPDHNEAECLRLAITSNQINYARVLLQGSVSTISASRALGEANVLEDLETFEEIVKAIVEKGVSQASLTKCLHDSVEKGSTLLAPMLIERGAVLDYGNAQCVRRSLHRRDFALLGKLLEGSCQPSVLGGVLPDAMKIQPPSERFEVMSQLLKKGVSGKELHIALQTLAANMKDQADYSLVEALMNHNASVDFFDRNGNCICTAAAQHNERALDLLCQGNPSPDTASSAIKVLPVSFETAGAVEYEQQVGMMSALLEKGVYGPPLAEMLITAVRDDRRQKALTALIRYRADANYHNGKAIEEALGLPGISALELICKGCKIEKSTFVSQLSNVLDPAKFNDSNLDKATLLVRTSTKYGYKGVLNKPLLDEVETRGSRVEVIKLLLGFGASANFQNARALQIAISAGNVEVCRLLLASGVEQPNIALAFPATSGIVDRGTRYELMKSLLEAGKYGIGQDQALVQACQEAIQYDLTHVDLLLEYQASANFNDGAAVLASVDTSNLPLLKRLVHTGLNRRTMADACTLIRRKDFTRDERYQMLQTLLSVFSDEDQASVALIEAVERDPQDIKTASLLLDHGASLETKHALAMQLVASAGSLELLNILLSKNPSQSCRDICFNSVATSLLSNDQRLPVYRALLETGITQDMISAALFEATGLEIIDTSVLSLLIDFNASLDYDNGSAIHRVVTRGDLESLNVLFRGVVSSKETLDRSFSASMELTDPHRLTIAKALLEKEPGVNQDRVSNHLAQIVEEEDHDLLSLMMDYEPDPAYNEGESLRFCAQSGDAKAAELLARAKISSLAVYHAFETLLNCRTIQSKPNGLQTARVLLSMGVTQTLVDRALLDGFDEPIDQLTHNLVELLIPYNPYINGGGGKFFVDTATNGALELFMRLASQKPDLNIVIPALIRAFKDENELLTWLTILEESTNRGLEPLQDFVIFIALTEFPTGNLLIKHLLGHGCPANSKTDSEMYQFTSAETMTLLIWALSPTTPTISEAVIMEILQDGHDG